MMLSEGPNHIFNYTFKLYVHFTVTTTQSHAAHAAHPHVHSGSSDLFWTQTLKLGTDVEQYLRIKCVCCLTKNYTNNTPLTSVLSILKITAIIIKMRKQETA